jgi:hypothetical protein
MAKLLLYYGALVGTESEDGLFLLQNPPPSGVLS